MIIERINLILNLSTLYFSILSDIRFDNRFQTNKIDNQNKYVHMTLIHLK